MARQDADDLSDRRRNGKGKTTGKTTEQAEFRGYINVQLSDEEKLGLDAWAIPDNVAGQLVASVDDGVVFSLKGLPDGTTAMASATQRRTDSPNAGLCVTARASTPGKAWLRLLYVLSLMAYAARWEDVVPMADPDRW